MSGLMLRLKAKELANDPEFKASLGWYQNWKRRHSVSLRMKTTLAQCLPDDLENKILQFHHFVIAARQQMQYPLAKICNMDETPMRFELPSSRTLESMTKLQYNTFARLMHGSILPVTIPPPGQPRGQVQPFGPGGGKLFEAVLSRG